MEAWMDGGKYICDISMFERKFSSDKTILYIDFCQVPTERR